jgi:2-keto-3-deoxy-L-rhamnonate aldolase RhmA
LGSFLNLGSPLTAEIMALSGLDWLVIDLEHGAGGEQDALAQLQAVGRTTVVPLVRVEALERPRIHRALDAGAAGVLVPRLEDEQDAVRAVSFCRYSGRRGVARGNRTWQWGTTTRADLNHTDERILCAVQIETTGALAAVRAIAAVEGIDILFVGPADLAHSLEIDGPPDHPQLIERTRQVAKAALDFGKVAGILVETLAQAVIYYQLGFRFIGCSSDGGLLTRAARELVESLRDIPLVPTPEALRTTLSVTKADGMT